MPMSDGEWDWDHFFFVHQHPFQLYNLFIKYFIRTECISVPACDLKIMSE